MHDDFRSYVFCIALCLLLGACSGNGAGLDSGGRPLPPGGSTGGALIADFDSIQQHVFTPICTVCHAGGAAPQGLRLDAANSYAMLVGVPSNEVPALMRVKPGDPDSSYIIQKLEGHASVGAQMPFGGPALPPATIAVIRQWISDGALRSPVAATAKFAVTTAVPGLHELVLEAPSRVVVEFSGELDQTRLDGSSVRLERLGMDGATTQVGVTLVVAPGDPRTLLVEPHGVLGVGRYRLAISGAPATGVSGISGALQPAGPDAETLVSEFEVVGQP